MNFQSRWYILYNALSRMPSKLSIHFGVPTFYTWGKNHNARIWAIWVGTHITVLRIVGYWNKLLTLIWKKLISNSLSIDKYLHFSNEPNNDDILQLTEDTYLLIGLLLLFYKGVNDVGPTYCIRHSGSTKTSLISRNERRNDIVKYFRTFRLLYRATSTNASRQFT